MYSFFKKPSSLWSHLLNIIISASILRNVKKTNSYIRNIYEEGGKILTLKHGYPQFYTQILFEKDKQEIFIKAVLNDIESVSKVSTCKKIKKFDQQS